MKSLREHVGLWQPLLLTFSWRVVQFLALATLVVGVPWFVVLGRQIPFPIVEYVPARIDAVISLAPMNILAYACLVASAVFNLRRDVRTSWELFFIAWLVFLGSHTRLGLNSANWMYGVGPYGEPAHATEGFLIPINNFLIELAVFTATSTLSFVSNLRKTSSDQLKQSWPFALSGIWLLAAG